MRALAIIGATLILVGITFGGYRLSLVSDVPYVGGLLFGALDVVLIFLFGIFIVVDDK